MVTFNILGCCVSRIPIETLKKHREDISVNQYVAFVNPFSISSDKGERRLEMDNLSDYNIVNFRKRNLCLDVNKEVFDYLFEKKSDYIIIDLLDSRFPMIKKGEHYITIVPETITRTEKENEKFGWTDYVDVDDPFSISDEEWDRRIDTICSHILEHYRPERIIVNEAYGVLKLVNPQNGAQYNFTNRQIENVSKYNPLVKRLYCRLLRNLKGCHCINFPKRSTVFGDSKNKWGTNPLHYWEPYYEYSAQAINLISQQLSEDEERQELRRLKAEYENNFELYKMQTQINGIAEQVREIQLQNERFATLSANAHNLRDMCKNVTDINVYLDLIKNLLPHFLVVLAICDSSGNALQKETVNKLREIGFSNFKVEGWRMYAGAVYKSLVICDSFAQEKEIPVNYENQHLNLRISSNSYPRGNKAEIIINGTDYAVNIRGLNIVIYDTDRNAVVDSVAYDRHFADSVGWMNKGFVRKTFD